MHNGFYINPANIVTNVDIFFVSYYTDDEFHLSYFLYPVYKY